MKKYYIGLDGGSTYLKAALIGNGRVIDTMWYAVQVLITTAQQKR